MNVRALKSRTKLSRGVRSRAVTMRQDNTSSFSRGKFEASEVTVSPGKVDTGAEVTVLFDLREKLSFIGDDPDLCDPPEIWSMSGLQLSVSADPDWTAPKDTIVCVPVKNFSSGKEQVRFGFTAPSSPGEYDIRVEAHGSGSGIGAGTDITLEVVDDGSGRQPCDSNSDCPGDKKCSFGECIEGDGDDPTENIPTELLAIGGVAFLFLIVILVVAASA